MGVLCGACKSVLPCESRTDIRIIWLGYPPRRCGWSILPFGSLFGTIFNHFLATLTFGHFCQCTQLNYSFIATALREYSRATGNTKRLYNLRLKCLSATFPTKRENVRVPPYRPIDIKRGYTSPQVSPPHLRVSISSRQAMIPPAGPMHVDRHSLQSSRLTTQLTNQHATRTIGL